MNQLLYYGKETLIHRTNSINFVLSNLESPDMHFMANKYYIVHSIIENTEHFLMKDDLIKCLELANLKEVYQNTGSGKKHNVGQYGIFLVGFIFKIEETMKLLEAHGIQDKVVQDIMSNHLLYTGSEYDRKVTPNNKLFFMGLASLILEKPPRPCVQMRMVKILVLLIDILATGAEPSSNKKERPTNDLDDSSDNDLSDDYMLDDDDLSRAPNRTVGFAQPG
jgi:hypothetical protein